MKHNKTSNCFPIAHKQLSNHHYCFICSHRSEFSHQSFQAASFKMACRHVSAERQSLFCWRKILNIAVITLRSVQMCETLGWRVKRKYGHHCHSSYTCQELMDLLPSEENHRSRREIGCEPQDNRNRKGSNKCHWFKKFPPLKLWMRW